MVVVEAATTKVVVDVVVDAEHSMVTASIAEREATGRVNAEATQRID